jgi:hypothetical protein
MLMLIRRSVTLARVLNNLRFELGVESSAAETELVLVVFRILNSLKLQKKDVAFR